MKYKKCRCVLPFTVRSLQLKNNQFEKYYIQTVNSQLIRKKKYLEVKTSSCIINES